MTALVFVYGTLMTGQPNHPVLVQIGAVRIGEATTKGLRTVVNLGPYPALLQFDAARDATRVPGEVYAIDESELATLDAFEGTPDLYVRERIAVEYDGVLIDAWTYVLATTP